MQRLTQWINRDISGRFPGRITNAEDLRDNEWLTKPTDGGGAGFGAQWDANFVHPIQGQEFLQGGWFQDTVPLDST